MWLNLCRPTADEIRLLTEELGLHQLAVEDALDKRQRAKLDRYDTHIFLTAYAASANDDGKLMLSEISASSPPGR